MGSEPWLFMHRVGTFKSAISPPDLSICIIDIEPKHLLKSSVLKNNVKKYCIVNQTCTSEEDSDKNITMKNLTILCPLYKVLCHSNNLTSLQCNHLQHVKLINGIPGLKDNQLKNNLGSIYHIKGEVKNGVMGDSSIEVVATGVTSFLILVGIFFPSVTGIMAGSNRSGDLKDPSASIPLGTISAIITTSLIYFIIAILLGCTVQGILLRDKNGLSIDQQLVEAMVAWPSPYVILVGALCACFGAALQCLIGAPRLLQAVAKDGIIPMIEPFQTTYRGEPLYALFLTLGLSEFSILLGDFDVVTSLVSEFFLICYFTVNLACFLQTIVREPSWRPRFRCYHWILSLVGALLCLTIMFIASWYFALITCVLALFIYKYIEYTGATKEWGEGLRGLDYVAARVALQRLDNQRPTHTKNWRPQILAFIKCKYTTKHWSFSHEKFLDILSQLKAGKGLIMTASVLKGQFIEKREIGEQLQFYLKEQLLIHRIDGFIDVLITEQIFDGISHLIQTSGVGAFRPNTVAYGWPTSWSTWQNHEKGHDLIVKFLDTIRLAEEKKYAVILLKNIDAYPSLLEYQNGYIDIWWVIHDGGLLFLLAFLFQQHDVWKKCILRLFTVCNGKTQKPQEMKENLEKYVYQLRIHAQVNIIEMPDQEISAYTYQRTMKLEERQDLLQQLKLNMNDSKKLTPFDSQLLPDDEKHLTKSELEHKFPTVFKNYPSNDINLHYTYTPHNIQSEQDFKLKSPMEKYSPKKSSIMENAIVMKKMHSAVRLNEEMKKVSSNAVLVLINLPSLPKTTLSADYAFMEFCEALTDGLFRCMLVKGSGKEVITIFS
ncbi:unnamed protein product [Didymodactylos carnosus]|uniref:Solute carrier family 12 member 6 n=1 Tax=Didymodactylos carnosus TaxID=1234261 RepID=A0A8S2FAT4_9BILA|nr:unnamed protein product [Didymodactylos carnosus]CAF4210705.1 unnamed protein product [Didymodactylos carnosus]